MDADSGVEKDMIMDIDEISNNKIAAEILAHLRMHTVSPSPMEPGSAVSQDFGQGPRDALMASTFQRTNY